MKCRICRNADLKKFLSLGKTPLANSFLAKGDLGKEDGQFPLEVCFCPACGLCQLNYIVDAEKMFRNYVYVSSTTKAFRQHFMEMAEQIKNDFGLNEKSLVVDIGSNDGILLKPFKEMGVRVIGVEPATNIANIAQSSGVETVNDFFRKNAVKEIIQRKGHADIVTANNVFAHIDNIQDVVNNVKFLLKRDGIFIIEVQYLVDTINTMTFDNVYHEHLSYYTLSSLNYFFEDNDMKIFKVQRVDSHGGSLRVFVTERNGKYGIDSSVDETLSMEEKFGVDKYETYEKFAKRVYLVKEKLTRYLEGIKNQGKTIAGYGAPAKSTTLLNFCGIGKEHIAYIVEDNPLKIGLFTPGTRVPIEGFDMLGKKTPDYILILAWNFADGIMEKTKKYSELGAKFIIPLPEPRIV